jgi:hypothetical protein
MTFYPYGGAYPYASRNRPTAAPARNPLPDNAMSNDTGDAGADGYTVLSRASRYTGERPFVGPENYAPQGPNMSEDQ